MIILMFHPKKMTTLKFIRALLDRNFLILSMLSMLLLLCATIVVFDLESGVNPKMKHYFDSLWWGVSTITTIGFGDVVPITFAGRLVGIALMFTGPVLFVLFTGALLRVFIKDEVSKELLPIDREMKKEGIETKQIERILKNIEQRLDKMDRG
jgi:voltage-gated potassium channel